MKPEYEIVRNERDRRFIATCPHCGWTANRAKRESAIHLMDQHLAYSHDPSDGVTKSREQAFQGDTRGDTGPSST